jgi:ABC-type Zn uptake system ZnuABC Zn-binding protein ZnuA
MQLNKAQNNPTNNLTTAQKLQQWKQSQPNKIKTNFFRDFRPKADIFGSQNSQIPNQNSTQKPKLSTELNPQNLQKIEKDKIELNFWERITPSNRVLIFGISALLVTGMIVLSWFWLFAPSRELQDPTNAITSNYNEIANTILNPNTPKTPTINSKDTILIADYGVFQLAKYLIDGQVAVEYLNVNNSIESDFELKVLESKLIMYTDTGSSSWIVNYLAGRNYNGKTLEIGPNLNKISQYYNFGKDYSYTIDENVDEFAPQPIDTNYQLDFGNIVLSSDKLAISISQAFPVIRDSVVAKSIQLKEKISTLKTNYLNINSCKNNTVLTLGNNLSYIGNQFSYQYLPFGYSDPENLKTEEIQEIRKVILEKKIQSIFVSLELEAAAKSKLEKELGVKVLRLNALQSTDIQQDIIKALEWNLEQFKVGFGC